MDNQRNGFTLIELAIVLAVIGILVSVFSQVGTNYFREKWTEENKEKRNDIHEAIANFIRENNRYPAPADPTLALGNPDVGREDAAAAITITGTTNGGDVLVGAVPVGELGLPLDHILDGYGYKYTYAVSAAQTLPNGYTIDSTDAVSFAILVADENGNIDTTDPMRRAPFALVSHGENGEGSFTSSGVQVPCVTGRRETQNCDFSLAVAADTQVAFLDTVRAANLSSNQYYNDTVDFALRSFDEDDLWDFSPNDPDNIYNLNTGNVGIGQIDPQARLDVAGDGTVNLAEFSIGDGVVSINDESEDDTPYLLIDNIGQFGEEIGITIRIDGDGDVDGDGNFDQNEDMALRVQSAGGGNPANAIDTLHLWSDGEIWARQEVTAEEGLIIGDTDGRTSYNVSPAYASGGDLYGPSLVFLGGPTHGYGASNIGGNSAVNSDPIYMRRMNWATDVSGLQLFIGDNAGGHPSTGNGGDFFDILAHSAANSNRATGLFRVTSQGRVGINNVPDPQMELHVSGQALVQVPNNWSTIYNTNDPARIKIGIQNDPAWMSSDNEYGLGVIWDTDALILALRDNGSDRKDAIIGMHGHNPDDNLIFEVNDENEAMRITGTGNVQAQGSVGANFDVNAGRNLNAAGQIRVGNAGWGCNSSNAGAIRYNTSANPDVHEVCSPNTSGSYAWRPLGGGLECQTGGSDFDGNDFGPISSSISGGNGRVSCDSGWVLTGCALTLPGGDSDLRFNTSGNMCSAGQDETSELSSGGAGALTVRCCRGG